MCAQPHCGCAQIYYAILFASNITLLPLSFPQYGSCFSFEKCSTNVKYYTCFIVEEAGNWTLESSSVASVYTWEDVLLTSSLLSKRESGETWNVHQIWGMKG